MGENFDEEWFNLLKNQPPSRARIYGFNPTEVELLQDGSKVLNALKDLSKINTSDGSERVGQLLARFNNIFLYHPDYKKYFRIGPPLRILGLVATNAIGKPVDLIGIGPLFKSTLAALETWFLTRSRKLAYKEMAKYKKALDEFGKFAKGLKGK